MESTLARALTFPTLRNLWARAAVRRVCYTLIVLLGIAQCIKAIFDIQLMGMDFQQDYLAARLMLTGDDIFRRFTPAEIAGIGVDPALNTGMWQNAHPPTAIVLFLPFALGSFTLSVVLWTVFTALLVILLVSLISRVLGLPTRWPQNALVGLMLLNWYPVAMHLQLGQWTVLLAVLCIAALWCLQTGRDEWAGVLIGVAAVIKIYPVLLLGFGIWRWRPRFILAGIATGVVLVGLSLVAGVDNWVRYFTYAAPEAYRVYHNGYSNTSLSNLAARLFSGNSEMTALIPFPAGETVLRVALYLTVSCMIGTVLLRGRWRNAIVSEWALLLCATSLFSPLSWDHNLVMFTLPLALLWRNLPIATQGRRWPVIVAGLLSAFPAVYIIDKVRVAYQFQDVPHAVLLLEMPGMSMLLTTALLMWMLWKQANLSKDTSHV